ncbi:MAG: efflux RND transporter permease subunit, partial [Petrotogales bacterium]
LVEFGKTIENCSDEEITTALQDILVEEPTEKILVFNEDDPNEEIDYKRYPRFSKGKSIDSADIKNCYISTDEKTITFSIEVYDLSNFGSPLRPSLNKINVMEWYLDFENLITPDPRLDIDYRISAHIEPTHPMWEIGKGIIGNLRELFQHFRKRELFNLYKKEVFLWVKPLNQSLYFPIPLRSGNITFDKNSNMIHIVVSRDEFRNYGIATRVGSFELPAKLSNFRAGVRYYQTSILKRPGGRIAFNTTFLLNRIEKLRSRPILSNIATQILQKYGDITWEDFDQLFEMMEQADFFPERLALQDIDSAWSISDIAPDADVSNSVFFIYPYLFNDIQIGTLALLSKDYEQSRQPEASLMILQLDIIGNYDELLKTNKEILNKVKELDKEYDYVSVETTGESVVSLQINELTSEANQILGPSIFIIIMIILFISFRRTSYVFLPMLALVVSTIWLLGTMSLLGMTFNVIAVALIPLILGLGVDYSVHLFHNYRVEIEKGKTPAEAIKRSVKEIGTAMFLAWLTTFIAFMSFLSSNIPPIRDFGILLALGVSFTFINAITLLASFRYILDKRKKPKIKKTIRLLSIKNIMGKIASTVLRHQKKILLIMVLISLVFASGALHLERGFDMDQFVPQDNPAMELFDKIAEKFPYASEYQEYILIEGNVATVKTLKGIAETHKNIQDDAYVSRNPDGSPKVTSIYSIIKRTVKNNQSLVAKFNLDQKTYIPKTDEDVQAFYNYLQEGTHFKIDDVGSNKFNVENLGSMELGTVLYKNKSRFEATVIRVYIDASFQLDGNINEELEMLKSELNGDIEDYGESTAIATGMSIIQFTITKSLTRSQIISTGISLLLAALVLIIAYRNPMLGIITIIPIGISIVWILGTMYFFGYILDALTVTVTSITIGIGIDYAI